MKKTELKQLIKEEVDKMLNEAESSKLAEMSKEIKGVLDRKIAKVDFQKGTKDVEPTLNAVIRDIEEILKKYK